MSDRPKTINVSRSADSNERVFHDRIEHITYLVEVLGLDVELAENLLMFEGKNYPVYQKVTVDTAGDIGFEIKECRIVISGPEHWEINFTG